MPHLITVSGKHIDLEPDREYVLGRDPRCDVVVEDCSCSRRHMKISLDGSGKKVTLEDLESRNGTFLDGERIAGEREVPDGGQIHVGSTLLVLSHSPAKSGARETKTEMSSSETLFLGAPHPGRAGDTSIESADPTLVKGRLESVHLPDVIQVLAQMRRSGTLRIELPDGEGSFEFRGGRIVAAFHGSTTGIEAAGSLVTCRDGRFQFSESENPCERNIDVPTPTLLLELCRRIDESTIVADDSLSRPAAKGAAKDQALNSE